MTIRLIFIRLLQLIVLTVLFSIFFVIGSMAVSGFIPDLPSDPGLVSGENRLLIISFVNALIVMALILSSRWNGRKLVLS
ncbi:MAG: hypothetical protein EA391_00070 [Balneolaceae bacterium]|nr:MAG: hypothetical protein EA391_00070 [Balneolaceae bacterium]